VDGNGTKTTKENPLNRKKSAALGSAKDVSRAGAYLFEGSLIFLIQQEFLRIQDQWNF
jgi:hypothetical protein